MRMRALFVASPMVGHVLPLLALAHAILDAGHDVLLATAADGVDAAEKAGVPAHDVATRFTMGRVFARSVSRHPVRVLRMAAGDTGTEGVGHLFAEVTTRVADGTVALADEWRRISCCTRGSHRPVRSRRPAGEFRRSWSMP